MKFNPVSTMPVFTDLFDSFLGKDFSPLAYTESFNNPSVNIKETTEGFELELAAPGMQKDHFKINLDHNTLTISAEQKSNTEKVEGKYTRREFSYGSFKRSFVLPETIDSDNIHAEYTQGILHLVLPKREEAKTQKVKQIDIR